jgi:hypothetical protein
MMSESKTPRQRRTARNGKAPKNNSSAEESNMSADAIEINGNQSPQQPQNKETVEVAASQPQGGLVQAAKASGLELYQPMPLPQNRPIEPSHINVVATYSIMGNRPVVSSSFEISSSMEVSGHRPIAKSHLAISETYTVMGNRPVAPNEIEDMNTFIGYID